MVSYLIFGDMKSNNNIINQIKAFKRKNKSNNI